jgi:hypothetical protein
MDRHRLVTVIAAVLLLAAVLPADAGLFDRHTRGDGHVDTIDYDLPDAHRVMLRCGLDVHVSLGERQAVQLTVDGNLAELYDIEVRDGVLVIDAERNPRPGRGCGLDVVLTSLDRLEVEGVGDIDVYGDPAQFTRSVAGLGSIDRR